MPDDRLVAADAPDGRGPFSVSRDDSICAPKLGVDRPGVVDSSRGPLSHAARKLLADALLLSERERAQLVSDLLASLNDEADADWDHAWLVELDRRVNEAEQSGDSGSEWRLVRERILAKLAR